MAKVNLYTTLSTIQECRWDPCRKVGRRYFIQRGATATFPLDFFNKCYKLSNVKQATFLFKQRKNVFTFVAFSYEGTERILNENFSINEDESSLILKMTPAITKQFKVTEGEDDLVRFEIVVDLDINTFDAVDENDTIIEVCPPINVIDSIIADITNE